MARSTVPPPPPAPGGDADTPVPGTSGQPESTASVSATPAVKKTPVKKAAATKPSTEPPATAPAPTLVGPAQPNPYAPPPPATPFGGVPPSPYAGAPAALPSTLSALSLVFGIIGLVLSFFLVGLLPAIAGVILGHLALKREPHARGMAVGGLVTGYVGVAISILWALIILVPLLLVWLAVGAFGVTGGLTGGF